MMMNLTASISALLITLAPGDAIATPQTDHTKTRAIMSGIASDLAQIYPLSISDERWASPEASKRITAHLDNLSKTAAALKTHMQNDHDFAYLSGSLLRDVNQARSWFEQGRLRETGFVINHLVENCFACHTKLPASQKSRPPIQIDAHTLHALKPQDRVRLLVATRQFDQALQVFEKLTSTPSSSKTGHFTSRLFIDYLKTALVVAQDPARAARVIRKAATHDQQALFVRSHLQAWVQDLEELAKTKELGLTGVGPAKSRIDRARAAMRYGSDQAGAIHLITASAQLHRTLRQSLPRSQQAEVLYLLGFVESLLGHSFWLTESRYFLEAAIRAQPHDTVAMQAYTLLEEQITLGYTGSRGTNIPADVTSWLGELRLLALKKSS